MRNILVTALLFSGTILTAQTEVTPILAQGLVTKAVKEATATKRKALIAFHASWCSWCKRLEAVLDRPEVKSVIDRYFVVQWLTVNEKGEKKILENPGSDKLLAEWTNGVSSGIPFYVLLDSSEKLITSSIQSVKPSEKPENIGFPGKEEERKAFIAFLKTGAPNMSASDEMAIIGGFEAVMVK
ncbi:MAG: thioredoxin family protein [Holophagales bacterium]|jgi:hypothetical protein|nr:thioredoxin family protein [Holophagales bacterium]